MPCRRHLILWFGCYLLTGKKGGGGDTYILHIVYLHTYLDVVQVNSFHNNGDGIEKPS